MDLHDEYVLPTNVVPRATSWHPTHPLLLTNADDNYVRVFSVTADSGLQLVSSAHEGELVLDLCWGPDVAPDEDPVDSTPSNPTATGDGVSTTSAPRSSTATYFCCSRGKSIHLRSASSGKLLASFLGKKDEEVTHAFSLCFSGSYLFAGYESCVKIFNITNRAEVLHITTNTRKRNYGRHCPRGIIGAVAYYAENGLLVVGSYAGEIAVYDPGLREWEYENDGRSSSSGQKPAAVEVYSNRDAVKPSRRNPKGGNGPYFKRWFVEDEEDDCDDDVEMVEPMFVDQVDSAGAPGSINNKGHDSHMGGITQLSWVDEHFFLSGHRKDSYLRLWDIRRPNVIFRLPRRAQKTNQRLGFSVAGPCALSGDDSGHLHWYRLDVGERCRSEQPLAKKSVVTTNAQDVVVSATWSMAHPFVATASGSNFFGFRDENMDKEPPKAVLGPNSWESDCVELADAVMADAGEHDEEAPQVHAFRVWKIRTDEGVAQEARDELGDCGGEARKNCQFTEEVAVVEDGDHGTSVCDGAGMVE